VTPMRLSATPAARAAFFMTLATFLWAGTAIAGKVGVGEFPPFTLSFLRFLLASAVMFVISREASRTRLSMRDILVVVSLGLTGMFANNALFFVALQYTSVINVTTIAATSPLMTSLLAAAWAGERLTSGRVAAILLAFAGVVSLLFDGDIDRVARLDMNVGDLCQIAGIFAFAVYNVVSKRFATNLTTPVIVTWGLVVATVATIPFALLEHPVAPVLAATAAGWGGVVYTALFGSCAAYLLQQDSIKIIGAARTAGFMNLIPVFTMAMAAVAFGERVTPVQIASAAVIILGVSINSRLSR